MDKLDWKILDLLQENARYPIAEIGRKIGLSASAVAERIQKMEENEIIETYSIRINKKNIGLPLSAYISLSVSYINFNPFVKALENFPELEHCSRVTGKDCLIMRFNLRDSEHLEEVINRLAKFGDPSTLVILSDIIKNKPITNPIINH
ncbi:Lrp/AsnC family transcriptional regulator [Galbibacter sp. EGI 63066]|uniref:Lrp/AsnC family transcriptional regulator n=1 Tax=Galbibacter sp. EGI 63066 TaxID=2993559 RepID=UPI0022493A9D|nr:Lrp/AsnC family transcriptional regulator [Galbibacter sp. EGI 63066]MCX2679887.1 Lrp/AsnC family transcriptional regulator [Galbibacter sp. EGI 63066]